MKPFSDLNAAEKFILAGNIITAVGALAISIGSVIRLAVEGQLPSNRPANTNSADTTTSAELIRQYFT